MSVQLAVTGEQDVYITGTPSITYFKAIYKRHTPFLKQIYEVPFDNQPVVTGATMFCTLPIRGDIVTRICLKTFLPTVTSAYYDGVGTRIVTEARLTVGGQLVSTITGAYIDLKNSMEVPYENRVGLQALLLTGVTNLVTPKVYTNMDFGIQNLPLCSLSRHDVILEIDFNPALSVQVSSSNVLTSTLLIEYATIGNRELKWFTDSKQTYVYDSLIYRKFSINSGQNILNLSKQIINPVKEIYITAQTPGNINTYTYSTAITNIALTFNGQDLINYSSDYWYLIEPFENKIVTPSRNLGLYVFKEPVNFSRIREVLLTLTTPQGTGLLNVVVYFRTKNVFVAENGLGTFMFM